MESLTKQHLKNEPIIKRLVQKNKTMISMPHPCSEDFSKMRKTQIGAYCNQCSTETIDLFKLSKQQVNDLLLQSKLKGEAICGRISDHQMRLLNQDFIHWKNQNRKSFQSKFIFAIIIGFGLSLFSCTADEKATLNEFANSSSEKITLIEKSKIPMFPEEKDVDLSSYVDVVVHEKSDSSKSNSNEELDTKYMVNEVPKLHEPDSNWYKGITLFDEEWIDQGPLPGSQIKIEDEYFQYLIDTNLTKN